MLKQTRGMFYMEFININSVNGSLRKSIRLDEELCAAMSYNLACNLPESMDYSDESLLLVIL